MGSSTSKSAKAAAKLPATSTARKYPTRSPPPSSKITNAQPPRQSPDASLGPKIHRVKSVEPRDNSINLESSHPDPSLSARLRTLGPVQPNPTLSNTSTYNFARSAPLSHSDRTTANSQSASHKNHKNQTSSSNSSDPTLTHTQFQPSASNPSQSIFPNQNRTAERENPAVSLLTARYRLAEEAEREFAGLGKKGGEGRRFLDVMTLRQVLVLREKGVGGAEIEDRLGLRGGVVARLGRRGVVDLGS